jgi:hypothetical protein
MTPRGRSVGEASEANPARRGVVRRRPGSPALTVPALLALAAGACRHHEVDHAPTRLATPGPPAKVVLPDGGVHHTERLAWVAWRAGGANPTFAACGRRTADLGVQGQLCGCVVVERAGAAPTPGAWTEDAGFIRDRSAVEFAPGGCRVLLDDVPGDPGAPPARATLLGPGARLAIDEWRPPATVDGDYFAIETSYSPDGRWLAVVRAAVGIGDADRLVELSSVEVRPAPTCR